MQKKVRQSDKKAAQIELLDCVLNGLNVAVYVSDMSTSEILYVNAELCRLFGTGPFIGRICWEALKNRTKRCETCPITYLLKNPGKSFKDELSADGKRYLVYDSIIPWINGRVAHLHYMVDITD